MDQQPEQIADLWGIGGKRDLAEFCGLAVVGSGALEGAGPVDVLRWSVRVR